MFALVFGVTFTSLRGDDTAVKRTAPDEAAKEKFFTERAVPLLREHCYECHSHESGDSSGNLMLDSLSGMLSGGS